jgi:hypothetical protein
MGKWGLPVNIVMVLWTGKLSSLTSRRSPSLNMDPTQRISFRGHHPRLPCGQADHCSDDELLECDHRGSHGSLWSVVHCRRSQALPRASIQCGRACRARRGVALRRPESRLGRPGRQGLPTHRPITRALCLPAPSTLDVFSFSLISFSHCVRLSPRLNTGRFQVGFSR